MANCLIGFPNRIDTSTLSNGSWLTTLPRSNLQVRTLGRVARSTDATLASTKVDINQNTTKNIRLVMVVNHTITLDGKYRLRASQDPTFATSDYDSGWVDVWPVVYPSETLEWESDSWWTGKYSEDDLEGLKPNLVIILPSPLTLQYWRLEIDDTSNPAGYVDIGRIFIGPAWQPLKNPSFGLSSSYETKTDVQEALGGAEYFGLRTPYRVTRFVFDFLSENEGLANAFDIDRRAGIDKEVAWVQNPDDTVHAIRRQFMGRLRQLSPIEYPYFNTIKKAYEIKELL